jgi:hypothetical protein
MKEDLLSKFLKLMSSEISDSDLELINLGESLGLNLVSFAKLRASQEDKFTDEIRNKALEKMNSNNENKLNDLDSFYAGSIDFMVSNNSKERKFFLLETNGGSHRGLSILTEKQQILLYNGYLMAIYQAIKRNKNLKKMFVLIGVPDNDGLIHEKVIMIEYFRKTLKSKGYSVKIFNTNNYDKSFDAKIIFLIADYEHLSKNLSFSDNWIEYKGEKVCVLIGDGIIRRFKNSRFLELITEDFHKIKSILVNPIFNVTDDKSLTYLASYFCKDLLTKYNLRNLLFTKAFNENELVSKLNFLVNKYKKSFIIKPNGGSGGAGVIAIPKDENLYNIKNLVEESKKEFFRKFMKNRDPFPYTIQEMADFSVIDWHNGKHTFDLRIYLAQREGKVIPIGGLARIAREQFKDKKKRNKQEFVVNLSGYNGQIEVERGKGFSEKNCSLLNLTKEDFVNMFCIGSVLFTQIIKNYERIINFSNWDRFGI